jgi:YbgC/YbaW family acyl-CoA thioester hydrolase
MFPHNCLFSSIVELGSNFRAISIGLVIGYHTALIDGGASAMYSKFESIIPLRPSDFDYNGHVHHSKYFDLLLAARHDQMERCYKMSADEFHAQGLGWMVRGYTIEYKRGLTMGDFATVRTQVIGMGDPGNNRRAKSIGTIGFDILVSDTGKVAAQGTATYVMVDIKTGKPQEITPEIQEKYAV